MVSKSLIITHWGLEELKAEIVYFRMNASDTIADRFKADFQSQVESILPNPYIYPECRFLPTKTQIYRNIIWGNYLIIYKIKLKTVEVLSLFHSKQKPAKIKMVRMRK